MKILASNRSLGQPWSLLFRKKSPSGNGGEIWSTSCSKPSQYMGSRDTRGFASTDPFSQVIPDASNTMGETMYFKQLQSDINNRVSKEWMELIVKRITEQGVLAIRVDCKSQCITMGIMKRLLLEKAGMYKM